MDIERILRVLKNIVEMFNALSVIVVLSVNGEGAVILNQFVQIGTALVVDGGFLTVSAFQSVEFLPEEGAVCGRLNVALESVGFLKLVFDDQGVFVSFLMQLDGFIQDV